MERWAMTVEKNEKKFEIQMKFSFSFFSMGKKFFFIYDFNKNNSFIFNIFRFHFSAFYFPLTSLAMKNAWVEREKICYQGIIWNTQLWWLFFFPSSSNNKSNTELNFLCLYVHKYVFMCECRHIRWKEEMKNEMLKWKSIFLTGSKSQGLDVLSIFGTLINLRTVWKLLFYF